MKILINKILPLLKDVYKKTHIPGALLENGIHSEIKINNQVDIYHAIFHLERILKNLQSNNEQIKYDCDDCAHYPCILQSVSNNMNNKMRRGLCGDYIKKK